MIALAVTGALAAVAALCALVVKSVLDADDLEFAHDLAARRARLPLPRQAAPRPAPPPARHTDPGGYRDDATGWRLLVADVLGGKP